MWIKFAIYWLIKQDPEHTNVLRGGSCAFWKAVFGKGRNAIEVDNEDALIEAIEVCRAAVKAGELNKALQAVAEIKSKQIQGCI